MLHFPSVIKTEIRGSFKVDELFSELLCLSGLLTSDFALRQRHLLVCLGLAAVIMMLFLACMQVGKSLNHAVLS